MSILKAISLGLLGALAMLVIVVTDDGMFEIVSRLRHGPEGRTWINPISYLVRSYQEGDQKALRQKCSDERRRVERTMFLPSICTIDRSRTCVMGRLHWTGGEIRAPLVSEELWDYPGFDDRFSMLGNENLRFQLSESSHILNEALSNGAVDFDRRTVSFNSEALAIGYLGKIDGVCGALDLAERRHLILTDNAR